MDHFATGSGGTLPRARAQSARGIQDPEAVMAIITISRGTYSKGKEIAEKVAHELGYECIYRALLLEASEHFNIPEIRLVRALHDAPSVLERFTHGKERYVAFIENAFLETVQKDNVVYHGLAGHFFLRGVAHGLKVRVIANLDDRVRWEMERESISSDEARHLLKKDDYERRRWALALYGKDTRDPVLYDLVVNIGNMSADCAMQMISHAVQTDCYESTPESQKALDDLVLASQVKVAVISEWPEVRVSAADSTVYVDVEAPLAQEAKVQEEISSVANTVSGVSEVRVNVRPRTFP
jgi:cytidylate kinase